MARTSEELANVGNEEIAYRDANGQIVGLGIGTNLSVSGGELNAAGGGGGSGDVVGPASATDNAIARYDTTTGKLIQNSAVTIDDAGAVSGMTQASVDNIRIDGNTISSTDTNGDINLTPNGTGEVVLGTVHAATSAGIHVHNPSHQDIALFWPGGGQSVTFYDGFKLDASTASRILSTDASKNVTALDTATYPDLTELSYVKGVTSAIQTQLDSKIPKTQNVLTKEPTGFDIPDNVVINYDPTTQKVTLTGTPWAAYYQGTLVSALTNGYVSTAHTNTVGHTYFYYYGDSGFAWSTDAFPGYGNLLIAKVVYHTTVKYAARECHGLMQWQVHQAEHNTIGTYVSAGGTIPAASYVLSSTTAGNRRPDVDQTTLRDEDCPTVNAALTSNAYCQVSLTGTGTTAYAVDQADILALLTNNPYYNSFSTPNWGQTLFPSNSVGTVWVYAQPATADADSQKYRYLFVQPQWVTLATGPSAGALATALTTELARNPSELNLGTLREEQPELVCIGRIALTYTGSNWSLRSVLAVTGTKYQQIAVPAGGFLSTVVTDATLTGGGTVADPLVVVQNYLTPGGVQSVTGAKTFDSSAAKVKGSSTGITSIASANASATDYVATLPAATGTLALVADLAAYVPTTRTLTINGTALDLSADRSWTVSGLAWGASIAWTSGTGLTLTVDNSASAGTVAQSIVVGNTQTNAATGLKIDTWTSVSTVNHIGIDLTPIKWGYWMKFMTGAVQATWWANQGIYGGLDYNKNSTKDIDLVFLRNEQNAGTGYNNSLTIQSASTEFENSTYWYARGVGISLYARGVGGTIVGLTTANNINSATNGLINYTLSNTQSAASVVQKIDLGTSAQGHTGLLVNAYNASASCVALKVDGSTTGTGKVLSAVYNSTERTGIFPAVADGASAIAYLLDTTTSLANASAKLLEIRNAGTAKVTVLGSGYVGMGTAAPSTLLHVLTTGEQLRLGYDTSNYAKFNVYSTGNTYLTLVGTTPSFYVESAGSSYIGLNSGATTDYATVAWRFAGTSYGQITMTASTPATYFDYQGQIHFRSGLNGTTRFAISSVGTLTSLQTYSQTVGATNRALYVDNSGVIGYVSSVRASKGAISYSTDTSAIHLLKPVTFQYRLKNEDETYSDSLSGITEYGLIAEDVDAVMPGLCYKDAEGNLEGVAYSRLVPMLLNEIIKLRKDVDSLS